MCIAELDSFLCRFAVVANHTVQCYLRWSNFQPHDFHSLERVFSMTFSSVSCLVIVVAVLFCARAHTATHTTNNGYAVIWRWTWICIHCTVYYNSQPNEDTINRKVNRLAYGKLLFFFYFFFCCCCCCPSIDGMPRFEKCAFAMHSWKV